MFFLESVTRTHQMHVLGLFEKIYHKEWQTEKVLQTD